MIGREYGEERIGRERDREYGAERIGREERAIGR